MRYLRIGYITVFFTPLLAIIEWLLLVRFLRFYNYDWLFPIVSHTALNLSIIGVQMFGLILCLLGIKKGEPVLRDIFFKAACILLILWGALAFLVGIGFYGEALDWSRLPGTRNLTIWDHMELATIVIEGLLWVASGIIFIATSDMKELRNQRMIWDSFDHFDYRVVDYTGWRYLENYGTFQHRAGVYLFANADLHIKYVGKAGPGRMVAEIEDAIRRAKDYGATLVKALYTNSDDRACSLETDLKTKYNPPNNRI